MRNAFAQEILAIARADPTVVVLSGDIGNRLFDPFKAEYPSRFMNVGVAEANMISMAAGLASCGFHPVCYTIAPFITYRCYEQIRVDVCYHQMPVTIVGTGSGLSYASLGVTHHSCEDLAVMRVLPEMQVAAPADAQDVRSCLRAAVATDRPSYLRLGKKGEPQVFAGPPPFEFGKWVTLREGTDLCLLSTGNVLPIALEVSERLAGAGWRSQVVHCASVKPLDEDLLTDVLANFMLVATLEEHSLAGGFGSAVAEWAVDHRAYPRRLLRFGTQDRFLHRFGGQDYARQQYGLGAGQVYEMIQSELESL